MRIKPFVDDIEKLAEVKDGWKMLASFLNYVQRNGAESVPSDYTQTRHERREGAAIGDLFRIY